MTRPPVGSIVAAALAVSLGAAAPAHATAYALTRGDRAEIERVLRAFFEAARDGNAAAAGATLPTVDEFRALFTPGADPIIQRHQRAVERDVRELRERFAGGQWVGLSGPFVRATTVQLGPCGRLGAPTGECLDGPVIDWRTAAGLQHLRIDTLVRIGGHWKIFDPRL